MRPSVVSAYLERLGIGDPGRPSAESLRRLHRAHVERVPYDNLDIQVGRPTPIDPEASAERIAAGGRGGYCFHLNGAFSELLRTLGFEVTRHLGGVQRTDMDSPVISGAHMAVTVRGLPHETCARGVWMVDVGLGSALHEPLPLVDGRYRQGAFVYGLRQSEVESGAWRFDHAPGVAFVGMDFRGREADLRAFFPVHERLATAPDSPFVRVATVQRRHAHGIDVLRGRVLTRYRGGSHVPTTIDGPDEWFAMLAGVFGLELADVSAGERARLWERVAAAHADYEPTRADLQLDRPSPTA